MESDRGKDCLECRLVSGTGLIGAGTYVVIQSRKTDHKWGKLVMQLVGFGR